LSKGHSAAAADLPLLVNFGVVCVSTIERHSANSDPLGCHTADLTLKSKGKLFQEKITVKD